MLIAKPGLDGHDRGALIVAQGLRDEGMEVIYTGLRQTAEQIVAAAIQEDVDCIGLSSLSGAHMTLFPAVAETLVREGGGDILLVGGGVIPPSDVRRLEAAGFAKIFTPGSTIAEMAEFIRERVSGRTEGFGTAEAEIDHVGVAVRNLEAALSLYRDHLGFRVVAQEELAAEGVRAILLQSGATRIELMEPLSASSPVGRFLDRRGEGLHHIAYRVNDVEHWLARAKKAGFQLLDSRPRPGLGGKLVAFLHPKSTFGVLTEYCQIHED